MQSELFETHEENSKIWKISEINSAIRKVLEKKFSQVWVKGEISNLKAHSSGITIFSSRIQKLKLKLFFSGVMQKI